MSHSIFIEESNGNGIYVVKTTSNTNNSSTAAAALLPTSISSEDLSQSLSEYTDADESMSAPTEFLAEFLSAVMLKDYKKGLKYCKLILQYEPNNATAKEFYPLIQEKLKCGPATTDESDENDNKSSSPELGIEDMKLDNGVDEDEDDDDDDQDGDDDEDDDDDDDDDADCEEEENQSSSASSEEGSNNSYSDDATSEDSDENIMENLNSNGSTSSAHGCGGVSRSDNTTHSYSSLLLEEDEEEAAPNLHLNELSSNLDANNGNLKSTSCSDSESPTEPLTQRLAAILRSKCVPVKRN